MKRNKPKRLQAFTILELTISMLISAIVIGITYTTYITVSRVYRNFKMKNEEMAILSKIDQLVKGDFDEAELIISKGKDIKIQRTDHTTIRYELSENFIVRNSSLIDTFKVSITGAKVFYEHQLKNELELNTNFKGDDQRIDELSFGVKYQDKVIPYHYFKIYSSENLNKQVSDAIHWSKQIRIEKDC